MSITPEVLELGTDDRGSRTWLDGVNTALYTPLGAPARREAGCQRDEGAVRARGLPFCGKPLDILFRTKKLLQ